jgi:hypothetical protein
VREWLQRGRHADHRPDPRTPDPGARDDDVRRKLAPVGCDGAHATVVGADARHRVAAEHAGTALERPARLDLGRANALGQPVGGNEISAENGVAVEQWRGRDALVGIEQPALEPPRHREPVPAAEVGEAFRRRRHLESAHLTEAPLPVELERAQLLDGVPRELGHGLRAVGLEHQPRGMRRRAAGRVQRALLEHGHVGPAAQDELVGETRAHDPGTDDHDPGRAHRSPS